ncbi:MAG: DNA polymerase IV, partial [Opitutaceae bacterium]
KTPAEVEAAVRRLQQRIWDELQITASFGLAANKLVAQIASKLRKPRGFVVVPPGGEAEFLSPLSVGKLPGVGMKTEVELARHGIKIVSDLFARSESDLAAIFGRDWRGWLQLARGIDDRPVETAEEDAKSYSQQETFANDVGDFAAVERVAKGMLDELMRKVRADRKRVRTMTVKVRYPDFSQESHGRSLDTATDLETPFYPQIAPLLRAAWKKRCPLRLVSVRLSGVEDGPAQLEMFAQMDEKRRRLAAVLDRLNAAGSNAAVQRGHQLANRPRPD